MLRTLQLLKHLFPTNTYFTSFMYLFIFGYYALLGTIRRLAPGGVLPTHFPQCGACPGRERRYSGPRSDRFRECQTPISRGRLRLRWDTVAGHWGPYLTNCSCWMFDWYYNSIFGHCFTIVLHQFAFDHYSEGIDIDIHNVVRCDVFKYR